MFSRTTLLHNGGYHRKKVFYQSLLHETAAHTQSDNYVMRLRLENKTGKKDSSTICVLFKVHPFCINTASDTI